MVGIGYLRNFHVLTGLHFPVPEIQRKTTGPESCSGADQRTMGRTCTPFVGVQGHMSVLCKGDVDFTGDREPVWNLTGSWRSNGVPTKHLCAVGYWEQEANGGISWKSKVHGLPHGRHSWVLAAIPKTTHEGACSRICHAQIAQRQLMISVVKLKHSVPFPHLPSHVLTQRRIW